MTDKKQYLLPLEKEPKPYPIACFDVEGVGGPNGFILGGLNIDDNYYEFTHPKQLVQKMHERKYKGYRIAAHNLTYDYGIIEPWLDKDDYSLLINGRVFKSRLTTANNNARYLIDSLLFSAGLSLGQLGKKLGYPKLETPDILKNIPTPTPEPLKKQILDISEVHTYLERDTGVPIKFLELFQTTINNLGGEMRFTLASTAMDLFRRAYLDRMYLTPFETRNEYARNAYYGGRVEPFKVGLWENVNVYDINSLYPYVMLNYEYPDPNTMTGPIDITDPHYIWDYEGVSDVTLDIPESHIPPLPYRSGGKLYFPTGIRRAHYTHIEIREAIKRGAKLKDVHSTLYTRKTCQPFIKYVTDLYNWRLKLKQENDPRELVVKILLNSLYGKFGQRQDAGLQEIKSFEWWFYENQHKSVQFREIDGFVTVLNSKVSRFQPSYVNTLWASYITAYARLTLLRYMEIAQQALIYSDTDSVFINGELDTSTALGAMKLENAEVTAEVYGPKAYRLFKDGELVKVKCKGVPTANRDEFLTTGRTTFNRPVGLLEASHLLPKPNGDEYYPSEWRDVTKQAHEDRPKRFLYPPNGHGPTSRLTRPFSVEELAELER